MWKNLLSHVAVVGATWQRGAVILLINQIALICCAGLLCNSLQQILSWGIVYGRYTATAWQFVADIAIMRQFVVDTATTWQFVVYIVLRWQFMVDIATVWQFVADVSIV